MFWTAYSIQSSSSVQSTADNVLYLKRHRFSIFTPSVGRNPLTQVEIHPCFVLFCFFLCRKKFQPRRQFSEAPLQPSMYRQAAPWWYVTYLFSNPFPLNQKWSFQRLMLSQISHRKTKAIWTLHVDVSPPHLFLCPASTCSGCCWEPADIKWFPWEATESRRVREIVSECSWNVAPWPV